MNVAYRFAYRFAYGFAHRFTCCFAHRCSCCCPAKGESQSEEWWAKASEPQQLFQGDVWTYALGPKYWESLLSVLRAILQGTLLRPKGATDFHARDIGDSRALRALRALGHGFISGSMRQLVPSVSRAPVSTSSL